MTWTPTVGGRARVRPDGVQRWMRGETVHIQRIEGDQTWASLLPTATAWQMPLSDLESLDVDRSPRSITPEEIAEAVQGVLARRQAAITQARIMDVLDRPGSIRSVDPVSGDVTVHRSTHDRPRLRTAPQEQTSDGPTLF